MGCKDGLLSLRWVRIVWPPSCARAEQHQSPSICFSMLFFSLHVSAQRHDCPLNLSPPHAVPDGESLSNGREGGTFRGDAVQDVQVSGLGSDVISTSGKRIRF